MGKQTSTPHSEAAGTRRQPSPSRSISVVVRSLFATLLLCAAAGAGAYVLSHVASPQGDEISSSDAQARLEAFRALAPLTLTPVADGELDHALASMQLDPTAENALRADLNHGETMASAIPTPQGSSSAPQQATQPASPARQSKRLQLVWITLWDTDVEDGDVVRIDSQGYSRTVRLTKHGDTFAVPVPADGVIKITGVSDGDGGGITVGLASGNARAIFPIMSEGQELGLKVRLN